MRVPEGGFTKIFGFKLSISIFLVFAEIAQEITFYFRRNVDLGTHILFYSGFSLVSWTIGLSVLYMEWSRGTKHDFTLPIWWTSMFVVGSIKLQALLDEENQLGSDWSFYYFIGTLILTFVIAVLGLFSNQELMPDEYRLLNGQTISTVSPATSPVDGGYGSLVQVSMRAKPNPENKATFFSRFTFQWIQPLLSKGYSRPLQQEDIFELSKSDTSVEIYKAFEKAWREESTKPEYVNFFPLPLLLFLLYFLFLSSSLSLSFPSSLTSSSLDLQCSVH
jgi:hypothetical protein